MNVLLQRHFNALKIFKATVPDEIDEIQKMLINYSDILKLNLIITIGGTGCFRRDVTPDATRKVIECKIPKLSKKLSKGLGNTQFAAFTRAACGRRGQSVIINFPGNQRACDKCFEATREVLLNLMKLIQEVQNACNPAYDENQDNEMAIVPSSSIDFGIEKTEKGQQHQDIEVAEALELIFDKIRVNIGKICFISLS